MGRDALQEALTQWEVVEDAAEEVLLLWALRDPFSLRGGALTAPEAQALEVELCGQSVRVQQSPSCLRLPGVTGSVLWDSGVVLARLLEYLADSAPSQAPHAQATCAETCAAEKGCSPNAAAGYGERGDQAGEDLDEGPRCMRVAVQVQGAVCCELGAGCGLLGCALLMLGASHVVLTDQQDRLRLLANNVHSNLPPHAALLPDRHGRHHCTSVLTNLAHSSANGRGSPDGPHITAGRASWHGATDAGQDSPGSSRGKGGRAVGSGRGGGSSTAEAGHGRSSAEGAVGSTVSVEELVWGEEVEGGAPALGGPFDLVLGSDVVYSEEMVRPLLDTVLALCGPHTVALIAGELRNDAVLELFLEEALRDFTICRAPCPLPHRGEGPTRQETSSSKAARRNSSSDLSFMSPRVVVYALFRKDSEAPE